VIFNATRVACAKTTAPAVRYQSREAATGKDRDFASLLDDLFVAAEKPVEVAPRATIPFDYLAVADELHSGRIKVGDGDAAAEYRATNRDAETELDALLGEIGGEKVSNDAAADAAASSAEALVAEDLPTEPAAIAIELALDEVDATELGRLRRVFALKNHPDRVPPQLRQRALQRMQVANGLIDEAKRRALAKARG
jgi:hypothetical protein